MLLYLRTPKSQHYLPLPSGSPDPSPLIRRIEAVDDSGGVANLFPYR
uniref:Uncharacterized protein n=1 Tax=Anguilla anguilla TaxID=7936 RepID=A0A0E9PEQ7_ANGAN